MKKTLILLLIFTCTFLLASCDKKQNNQAQDDNEKDDTFTQLVNAINYSMNYDGSFSTKETYEYFAIYDGEEYTSSYLNVVSYDKENKIGYYQSKNDVTNRTLKIFNENNTYYCFKKVTEAGKDNESLFSTDDFYKEYGYFVLVDRLDMSTQNILKIHLRGLTLASSLTEVKNAYDKVLSSSINNSKEFALVNDDLYYADGTTNSNITLSSDNNVISLTIEVTMNLADFDEEQEQYKKTTTVKASEGKVIELTSSIAETDEDNETYINSVTYNFEYSFDQNGYDEITTPQVKNTDIIENGIASPYDSYLDVSKKFTTENITHNDEWVNLSNLDKLGDKLSQYLSHEYYGSANFKGVYSDKEHKNPITNDNFTITDLMEIENIYVDVEIKDGCAAHRSRITMVDQLSKEYKIVLGDHWMYNRENSSTMTTTYTLTEKLTINLYKEPHLTFEEDYYYIVNGEKYSGNSIVVESGKEYYVEYIYNIKDSVVCLDTLFESLIEYN